MIDFEIDFGAFARRAEELGAQIDQVPFALSRAMNDAGRNARQALWQTWPDHIQQRNASFIKAALNITQWSLKHNLTLVIGETKALQGRAHLGLHADGGVKQARKRLAIPPTGTVTRTAGGVRKGQRPADIIAKTPKRALRITSHGIFVGEGGHLHLKYAFTTRAQQHADVPFREVFQTVLSNELRVMYPQRLAEAMASRRG